MSLFQQPLSQRQFRLCSLGLGHRLNFRPALEQKAGRRRANLMLPLLPRAIQARRRAWCGHVVRDQRGMGGWMDGWRMGMGERPEGKRGGLTNNLGQWAEAAGCV